MFRNVTFVARKCLQCASEFPDMPLKQIHIVDKSNPICPIHKTRLEEPNTEDRSLRRGWTKEPISRFIDIGEQTDSVRGGSQQSHDVDMSDVIEGATTDEDY